MGNKVKNGYNTLVALISARAHQVLDGTKGEAYVDTGVKILIAVVIGALLLVGLTFLFKNVIFEKVESSVNGMFELGDSYVDAAGA